MLAPAQNPRPAPLRRTARTAGSAPALSNTSHRASAISAVSELKGVGTVEGDRKDGAVERDGQVIDAGVRRHGSTRYKESDSVDEGRYRKCLDL
jgi:hypothetical protein